MGDKKFVAEKIQTINCDQKKVRVVRFNSDGKYALTAGSDKSDYGEILDVRSSRDNGLILSGGVSKNLLLHDVETKRNISRWFGHLAKINSVSFNEEGTMTFSASQDGTVRCYDLRNKSKTPIQIFNEATDAVLCISIKNHEIATGSADGKLRLYDLRNGTMTSDDFGYPVSSINFSSDNQCILVSILNSNVTLLDKVNGGSLLNLESHINTEYKLESCIMASENEIVSCSEDGYLYIYEMSNGKVVAKCDHKPNLYIHSVVSHPKEPKILSATGDKIYIWQLLS
ncbi:Mitogen-activated protein kinase organizer 1 [Strongyloides ratti]|uniref:WD repeat domain-containing protein 83 n=1 Tax=Strongyloides ratti TaxID=34506 RepID=A0A090MZ92_STRRB|nr:Mitogen-activated protein kinase organizer 1 [Strongyloides ratti]CEF68529.1 Mitogen-activated protein kinase organizer 1 [Strongyloides ratti]